MKFNKLIDINYLKNKDIRFYEKYVKTHKYNKK